jgi:cation diffusion facilitator family transporter
MTNKRSHDKQVLRIIFIEGMANVAVLIAKTIIGLSTGSMAILSDAVHSLTDAANNVVAFFVIRFSSMPADREHPYGHRKFETLAVFILASLLVVLSFQLAINALTREARPIVTGTVELLVMLGVLLVNIAVSSWQRYWANRLDSDILRADASHTFSDVLITSGVIVGWQLSALGYDWVDRAAALAVSTFVMYLAYCLFKRAIPVLTDAYAIDPGELKNRVLGIPGVENVYNIRSRRIGKDCAVDLVISVDPNLSTEQAHEITDSIEAMLEQKFGVKDASIHVEPHNGNIKK